MGGNFRHPVGLEKMIGASGAGHKVLPCLKLQEEEGVRDRDV